MSENENEDTLEKIRSALTRERSDHKVTRELLKTQREKVEALSGQLNEMAVTKDPTQQKVALYLDAAVQGKLAAATSAHLARIAALEAELETERRTTTTLKTTIATKSVETALRDAATKLHVKPEALADVLTLGKLVLTVAEDGTVKTTDGVTADDWLDARKSESPYWWPASRGSGHKWAHDPKPYGGGMGEVGSNVLAPGVGGNVFDPAASAFNLTKQGEIMKSDPALAARLKAAAGQK